MLKLLANAYTRGTSDPFTRLFVIVITLLNLMACGSRETTELALNVRIVDVKSTKYGPVATISLDFESQTKKKIVFDLKAFSKECGKREDSTLIAKRFRDLNHILQAITHSQIVIENKNGDMVFFSDYTDAFLSRPFRQVNCAADWEKNLELKPGNPVSLEPLERFVSDLKPKENDNCVRFHYMFKPTESQIVQGYETFYASSNWVAL